MTIPPFLRTGKTTSSAGAGARTVAITLNPGETAVFSYCQAWDPTVGASQKFISGFDAGTWIKQGPSIGFDTGGGTPAFWRTEKWTCIDCPSVSSITISFSAGAPTSEAMVIDAYSGVTSIGSTASTTGTTANPFIDFTTTGNDCLVHGTFINWDATNLFTSGGTTNLRNTATQGAGSDTDSATTDNSSASPASVRNEVTHVADQWGVLVVELLPAQVLPTRRMIVRETFGAVLTEDRSLMLTE